jgi:Raf kinase inhibitor-like YbhB/YbcL family protein
VPRPSQPLTACFAALALGLMGCGQDEGAHSSTRKDAMPEHSSGESIAILRLDARPNAPAIRVTSPAFSPDGMIPLRNSAYGDNWSPPLTWTATPGAQSYALIVEDPDAPRAEPFVHWIAWNIPGDVTSLPENLSKAEKPGQPQGMIQGVNGAGETGWFGPRPPAGHGVHRYHFQLFALDGKLNIGPDAELQTLMNAMKGRILAEGELVGRFEQKRPQ